MSDMILQEAVEFLRPFADKCFDAGNDAVYGRENAKAGRALKIVLDALPAVATATVVDAGWQDIASAPRDGTTILVANAEGQMAFAAWTDASGGTWDSGDDYHDWPTHWRATPTPPAGDV